MNELVDAKVTDGSRERMLYCRRGYLLLPVGHQVDERIRHWASVRGRRIQAYLHPETPWGRTVGGSSDVLVIGSVLDTSDEEMRPETVASRIASHYAAGGEEQAVRYIAYLGGRYLVIIEHAAGSLILGDAHQTLAAFWARCDEGVAVASHAILVSRAVEAPIDDEVGRIMNSPAYVSPGGRYYPGALTPYVGVKPIIANCLLRVSGSGDVAHVRFYPTVALDTRTPDEIYGEFSELFLRSTRAWAGVQGTGISLTAGMDSRVTLAAATGILQDRGGFSTTYYKFSGNSSEATDDLVVANKLSWERSLPHRIVPLGVYVSDATENARAYAATFPRGAQFPARAVAYMDTFSGDETLLFSTIAETGTVFYQERDDPHPGAARLAQKFSTSDIQKDPAVIAAFEDYIEYTEFLPSRMLGIDYHDLFYWEHRNSKWAAVWYSECDLAHKVCLPFNNRRLIELMLAVPEELRRSKYLLRRFIQENA